MKTVKSILVIATCQIGDVLLVTPLLHSLRKAYPDTHITVLAFSGKVGMLAGNQDIDKIIQINSHPTTSQHWQLLKRIFRRYDLAISTIPGDKPLIYASLAGRQRIACQEEKNWKNAWKRWLCHSWVIFDNVNTHTVLQNLQLAKALKIPFCFDIIPPKATTKEKSILKQLLPFDAQHSDYIVLHLLPLRHYKRWPKSHWLQLIASVQRHDIPIILTGGTDAEELEYIQAITAKTNQPVINLAGKLTFAQVAQLLKKAAAYVGPDTAVTHLAAACGTLTVALFGPTNPIKWSPWPSDYKQNISPFRARSAQQKVANVVLLQSANYYCIPCHQEGCDRHRKSDSRCMQTLPVEIVLRHVLSPFNFHLSRP